MTIPTHGGTEPADAPDVLLRRMSAAVMDLEPNIPDLINGGLAEGRAQVRRRRRSGWAAAVAAVAVVVVGSTYLASSELRSQRQEPTQVGELEPATPRGLAAAVLTHTESLGEPLMVGGWELPETTEPRSSSIDGLMMQVAYGNAEDGGVELQVVVSGDVDVFAGSLCADLSPEQDCQESTLDDGTRVAIVSQTQAGSADSPGATWTAYLVVTETEFVSVSQTAVGDTLTSLSQDELEAIAQDPMVGMSTGAEFNADGRQIEDFKKSIDSFVVEGSGSGSSSDDDGATSSEETATTP